MMLTLDNICKCFGVGDSCQHILKNISLSIKCGEFVAIVGKSGSGKSTLMNILGCLDRPSSGSYFVRDVDTGFLSSDQLADLRRNTFGFIFQRYNLLPSLTALENVALPAIYAGMSDDARRCRAEELLAKLEMASKQLSTPNEMSGGQQQRVSIARALMNGGAIILADEPTGALDTESGKNVMNILQGLHYLGHTVVIVTHDPSIASHAERIIEIQDGEIIRDNQVREHKDPVDSKAFNTPTAGTSIKKKLFFEAVRMAFHSIRSHKLRSILTTLGIIIGIASVVIVIALGKGSQKKILDDINRIGTNTVTVFPGKGFGDTEAWRVKTLTLSDSEAISMLPYIESASPLMSGQGVVSHGSTTISIELQGVSEQFFNARGINLVHGRYFNRSDVASLASVVVIDENAKKTFFPGNDPLGKVVFFNKRPLIVIGVARQGGGMVSQAGQLSLWAPYSTAAYKIFGNQNISRIVVKIGNNVHPQVAEKNITLFLKARHKGQQDFFTFNSDSIRQTVEKASGTLAMLVSGIAFISLVVGGIGVMNIMLVSVTERTPEIGIRMAIGARRSHILTQFLIEAVLLCFIGGLGGIVLAALGGAIFICFSHQIELIFSPAAIIMSLSCAVFIGIFFGFMPARNASLLSPIYALTRE